MRPGSNNRADPVKPAMDWALCPSGDSCLVIVLDGPSPSVPDQRVAARAAAMADSVRRAAIAGVRDVVPAMRTVGIHYDPFALLALAEGGEIPYQTLERLITTILQGAQQAAAATPRMVEIPVCYGGDHGPDLDAVAAHCALPAEMIIALHTQAEVSVLMLGFAPGNPYIGVFDARLSPPRRAQPRTRVPAGSIGLANRQSVIYPAALPGGWSLIGQTPLTLFDASREPASLLRAGDRIRFKAIDIQEFTAWQPPASPP